MYHTAQLRSPGSAGHKESNTNISDAIVYLFVTDSFQLLIPYFGMAGGREMGEKKDKKDSLSKENAFGFLSRHVKQQSLLVKVGRQKTYFSQLDPFSYEGHIGTGLLRSVKVPPWETRGTVAVTPTVLSPLFLFKPRVTNSFVFYSVPKLVLTKQPRQFLGFNCLIILAYFCSKDTSKEDGPPLKQHCLYNNRSSLTCALYTPSDFPSITTCLTKNGIRWRVSNLPFLLFFHILKDPSTSQIAVAEILLNTFYLCETCIIKSLGFILTEKNGRTEWVKPILNTAQNK